MRVRKTQGGIYEVTNPVVDLGEVIDNKFTQIKRPRFLGLGNKKTIYVPNDCVPEQETGLLKKGLIGILLTGAIALGGCKDKKNGYVVPPPVNHAPYIVTTDLGTATEGQDINQTIEGQDIDGDYPLNFSIINGPGGTSISPIDDTHALLSYIPTHNESDQTQDITVGVWDSTGKNAQKVYSVPVTNISDVTFTIRECGSGNPISGIDVSLGSDIQTTDGLGIVTFNNKQTGSYQVIIKDPVLAQYVTYKPRNIQVSKAEEDAGNLTLEKKLLPESYFDFMEPTVRLSGEICKFDPSATIIFNIYEREVKDNINVPQANIDLIKNLIKNKLSNRYGYIFTDTNIILHEDTLPPGIQPQNGHIDIFWNNNFGGAWNHPYTTGTRILSAVTRANTSLGEEDWLNEFSNLFTNSDDSNFHLSTRNEPPTQTNFTSADDIVDDFHQNRPEGNKNLNDGNPDNRDVDPNP